MNGLAQSTRPCTFVGFEKISILRASPAPDSAGPESGYQSPAPQLSWDIRPDRTIEPDCVGLNHSESIFRIV